MAITLFQLADNTTAEVLDILGGFGLKRKLESLGIRTGVKLFKVSQTTGPVILKIGASHLAVGRGMASKIIVEEK